MINLLCCNCNAEFSTKRSSSFKICASSLVGIVLCKNYFLSDFKTSNWAVNACDSCINISLNYTKFLAGSERLQSSLLVCVCYFSFCFIV